MIDFTSFAGTGVSGLVLMLVLYIQKQQNSMKAALFEKLDKIHDKVTQVNGRVGKLETWVDLHEEKDRREYQEHREAQRELKALIGEIRKG